MISFIFRKNIDILKGMNGPGSNSTVGVYIASSSIFMRTNG